jgi:hypothetical protein
MGKNKGKNGEKYYYYVQLLCLVLGNHAYMCYNQAIKIHHLLVEAMTLNKMLFLTALLCGALATSATFIFVLFEERSVKGIVVDAFSGEPISEVALEIASSPHSSDQQGRFATSVQANKNISLQATAPGYLPTLVSFDLPWYLKTGYIKVILVPLGLSIRVVDDSTAAPLSNVSLQMGEQFMATDQNGLIEIVPFDRQPPILISVDHPGYRPSQMELTRLPQDSSELPLVIGLSPRVLTGTVIASDDNRPLGGVTISADHVVQQTDKTGRFSLSRLAPGTLVSVRPNNRFLPTTFTFSGQSSVTVKLEPQQLTAAVVDSLSRLPVPGAQVRVLTDSRLTNAQGQVQFTRIPPLGVLHVAHPAYAPQATPYDFQFTTTIFLRPNAIQGVVRDAKTGQPLTTTRILVNNTPLPLASGGFYHLSDLSRPLTITMKHIGYKDAQINTLVTNADLEIQFQHVQTQPCQTIVDNRAGPCFDLQLQPFSAQAIYIPFSLLSQPEKIFALFDLIDRTELNAVVIDVKGDRGMLAWDSQVTQANLLKIDGEREGWMTLSSFLAEAKARDIYTIARMVIFKDTPLAFGNTDLAVVKADGTIWLDGEGMAWVNPFREEVWDYNIALAKEVVALGFDEINLDYIRFPSDGDLSLISYAEENTADTRAAAIRAFISRMAETLEPDEIYLSADVFGLTVWVEPEVDMNIGQRIVDIAPYVDYLAPMLYPSTFAAGNLGLANPSAYPYEVIFRSQNAAAARVPQATKVRPWLQAYWYTTAEMLLQKQAANDANAAGWIWWNAAGIYDEALFELE